MCKIVTSPCGPASEKNTGSYSSNEGSNARQHQRRGAEVLGSTLLVRVGRTRRALGRIRLGTRTRTITTRGRRSATQSQLDALDKSTESSLVQNSGVRLEGLHVRGANLCRSDRRTGIEGIQV